MCPSYLATRDEKDSTRGRARVLQELANGTLVRGVQGRRRCTRRSTCACPARAARPTARPASTWRPTRPRCCTSATGAGCARRRTTAWAGCRGWRGSRRARRGWPTRRCGARTSPRLAKRLGGIDARRPLPQFAPRTFRVVVRASARPAPATPVLLWVDTFTNHFTPEVGQAAVRVLEAAGYAVQITDKPVCCGLTWISTGQLDGARRQLRKTLDALDPALQQGIPIVGLEPSCTAVLRSDLAELLPDDPRAARVAAATRTLAELLAATRRAGRPRPAGRHRGGPAALPPARGDGLDAGRGAAARRPAPSVDRGRRLLRAGRQLRRRARPLRGVGRGGRDRAAARRPRRAARRGRARRRLLLPHPARAARRRPQRPPRPTPGPALGHLQQGDTPHRPCRAARNDRVRTAAVPV